MTTLGVAYGDLTYQDGVSPEEVPEEQYITTFFCRALYDYQTNDASSLSFRKNDVIEVLTQLESGWWDGLLGDERGWFPSNYVTTISEEEAELALSHYEQQALQHSQLQQVRETPQDSQERTGHLQGEIVQDHYASEAEWGQAELVGSSTGFLELGNAISGGKTMSNDFWMPQIYYINTQTGQHSRDLPLDIDDTPDGDLAGLTASQPSARTGTGAGLGFGALAETTLAGFGVPKRSRTPEPWIRRLADDGMSYFYLNKLTGQVSWTLPETEVSAKKGRARALTNSSTTSSEFFSQDEPDQITRSRSNSTAWQDRGMRERHQSPPEHISDSDDSAVYSSDPDISPSTSRSSHNGLRDELAPAVQRNPALELTAAERIAQSLQQSLAPSPPEFVSDLSHIARDAIAAVVKKNHSITGAGRRSEHARALDNLIRLVVVAVRNLLYISAPPSGHIPSQVVPRDARDRRETTAAQTLLKPAQRKVTATLSKLVLSARAMEYDSGPAAQETTSRIESDAEELDRAIVAFVVEVQRYHSEQHQTAVGAKRVQGCFSVIHVGLGLVGASYGGTWKGFGWVPMDDLDEFPQIVLSADAFSEFKTHMVSLQAKFGSLHTALRNRVDNSQQRVWTVSRDVLTGLLTLLLFVSNLHIARHVDIDGFYAESAPEENSPLYTQTVDRARLLCRTLESAMQALYDDASIMLLTTQHIRQPSNTVASQVKDDLYDYLDAISASIKSNLQFLLQTLDALLSVGHDQADIAEGDYRGAIEWRVSRLSIMDSHYDVRPMSVLDPADPESEDIVDIEVAFGAPGSKKGTVQPDRVPTFRSQSQMSDNTITLEDRSKPDSTRSASSSDYTLSVHTLVPSERQREDAASLNDDECGIATVSRTTTTNAQKIKKIFGDDAPEHIISTKPWYLRPDYTKNDMVIDVDGSVRAGTVPALVERLTSHETGDPTFIKTFLMTYKSFTTLDELFELLVRRFCIQPPNNLTPTESEEWKKLKQHIIQMRVLNAFKAMVADDDFLEKEDMYILDRMKEFLLQDTVSKIAISKQLVILIDRARAGEFKKTFTPNLVSPPTSIVPKANKRVKLLDVDPLELARQLTILESQLYQKIRPMECLSRSREQKTDYNDNIARVIQTSNRIANWVADTVLVHEDSRKRATILKQFISVADRCRSLHNYSSMVAIVSGLNSPPIRRLKRSWEQVSSRHMSQLNACEMTIDSGKNFTNYRSTLAKVAPPCVPFIGVFLTTLTFIQDGSKDTLPGNLVNFRKRQKASEVIQDIQRWQTLPHHFHPLSAVQMYIEESLGKFSDQVDVGDKFWNLSLEREPREREDEKMARLLQESGFL
ncbi:ras guanine nucleotide exchange factor domain-containing protein [Boletus edulis]|nr:ras guanine nucleotide exchange factor domain-containing protein [Boletus edulis]